jgi:ankyrin repeat protein
VFEGGVSHRRFVIVALLIASRANSFMDDRCRQPYNQEEVQAASKKKISEYGPPIFGPWLCACAAGDVEKVGELLPKKNRTVIHNGLFVACLMGQTATVKFLQERYEAELDLLNNSLVNKFQMSPAGVVVQMAHLELIDLLLTRLNVNELFDNYLYLAGGMEAMASLNLNRKSLRFLIHKYQLNISGACFRNVADLDYSYTNRLNLVRLKTWHVLDLLQVGLDPNLPARTGESTLYWACRRARPDLANILIAHGADPYQKEPNNSGSAFQILMELATDQFLTRRPDLVQLVVLVSDTLPCRKKNCREAMHLLGLIRNRHYRQMPPQVLQQTLQLVWKTRLDEEWDRKEEAEA